MPCRHIQHTDQTLYLGSAHWESCLLKSGKKGVTQFHFSFSYHQER